MRGFPIVSLGALLGGWIVCQLISPQFEIDEYYMGDEAIGKQAWSGRYPTAMSAGYIKNYTVNPNNLELSEGTQSSLGYSYGFDLYNNSIYFGIKNKLENISLYRIDSFYTTTLFNSFMNKYDQTFLYTNYISIYVNLPNILHLGHGSAFSSGSKVKNVFINSPKAQDIGPHFLANGTTITDLYMNAPNITQITGSYMLAFTNKGETTGIYLHSLTTSDINRLYTLIYNKRAPDATNLYKDTTCTYSDFDVRYWSEEQNNTGSDR